MKKSQINCS